MAQRKKQLIAEGKLDKHGRPNAETPPEYLRALPDANGCAVALCHADMRSTWNSSCH
jgi:H/ACA ribonucleoprotein complex subunit 4